MLLGWYPVGTVLAGLYSLPPLNEVVAPPPGMATRLCFSVEYRHSSEQLAVSLLRLGNLPPRFHGNVTLVELRRLPDDRRPRQAKARGTGPDPEFSDRFVFQARRRTERRRKQKSDPYLTRFPRGCHSAGVVRVRAPQHPERVCAERGAGRQTPRGGQGAGSSGGGARAGRQGAVEGPGDRGPRTGTIRAM